MKEDSILRRAAARAQSARAARAAALDALRTWQPGTDADALRIILSGATEGTPPACERTADGFRLFDSRALHALRFHPLKANGATRDARPSADPRIGAREPRVAAFLYQSRAARLIGRALDPESERDTWTGQGFAPNAADRDADARAFALDAAACESAQAALTRARRAFPELTPERAAAARPSSGGDALPPVLSARQRHAHAAARDARAAALRAMRAQERHARACAESILPDDPSGACWHYLARGEVCSTRRLLPPRTRKPDSLFCEHCQQERAAAAHALRYIRARIADARADALR